MTAPQARADAGRVEIGAITAAFLISLIGICLFALAVIGGQHAMCHVDRSYSYCHTAAMK